MYDCTSNSLDKPGDEKYLAGSANARAALRLIRHGLCAHFTVIPHAGGLYEPNRERDVRSLTVDRLFHFMTLTSK